MDDQKFNNGLIKGSRDAYLDKKGKIICSEK